MFVGRYEQFLVNMIIDWFDSLWFRAIQHLVVAAAVPMFVIFYCGVRRRWEQWVIILISYVLLSSVWATLLSIGWQPDVALILSGVATYAFIRSLAKPRPKPKVKPSQVH